MPTIRTLQQALLIPTFCALLLACQDEPADATMGAQGNSPATESTIRANAVVREELNLGDQQDFNDARRGLIAAPKSLQVAGPDGTTVWDMPSGILLF